MRSEILGYKAPGDVLGGVGQLVTCVQVVWCRGCSGWEGAAKTKAASLQNGFVQSADEGRLSLDPCRERNHYLLHGVLA